jgi:hypothetical protein
MPGTRRIRLKRLALYTVAASIGLSATVGIFVLILGGSSDLDFCVLLTTLTVSAASIGALCCAAVFESKHKRALPLAGMVLVVAGAGLLIVGVWADPNSSSYWRVTYSVSVLGVATVHLCLLSLARLAKRHAWSMLLAYVLVYGLALALTIIIWRMIHGEGMFRFAGVLSILVAVISIAVPVLHKLSSAQQAIEMPEAAQGDSGAARLLCPLCGAEQTHPLGEITCRKCRCVFLVKVLKDGSGRS